MRVSLPLMIVASVAVHLCLGLGIVLSHFHLALPRASLTEASSSTTMDLQPLATAPAAAPVKVAPAPKLAEQQPAPPPPVKPKVEQVAAAKPAPPLPRLEANPNANLRALPPEAILSPTPPPQLDGANGVVFVLDISGSMYESYNGANRLAFARQALARRITALKDGTPFAIVLYAQHADASGPLIAASRETREAAVRFLQRDVDCGGGTDLPSGLFAAAELHTGSIVVASDGDLNDTAYSLTRKIREAIGPVDHGPMLSIIGIAPRIAVGDDRLLETIAEEQGGSYAVDEFAPSTVTTVAR
jgi:hypothetical protein